MPILLLLLACTSGLSPREDVHFPPTEACVRAGASIERALCGQQELAETNLEQPGAQLEEAQ